MRPLPLFQWASCSNTASHEHAASGVPSCRALHPLPRFLECLPVLTSSFSPALCAAPQLVPQPFFTPLARWPEARSTPVPTPSLCHPAGCWVLSCMCGSFPPAALSGCLFGGGQLVLGSVSQDYGAGLGQMPSGLCSGCRDLPLPPSPSLPLASQGGGKALSACAVCPWFKSTVGQVSLAVCLEGSL